MRPAIFLFLFGVDICITFLPLHMKALYEPVFGLSENLVIGLPISIEMLFAGLSVFISGTWIDRRGWHEPFIVGLFAAFTGSLYSWLSPNMIHFIISRGIVGLGWGFCMIASQGFVISHTDEKTKAQGLTQLFAGIYAGSICGGAFGSMLSERIGYSSIFLIGAFIILSVGTYTLLLMRSAMKKQLLPAHTPQIDSSLGKRQIFRFLFDRNVFGLIMFSRIPATLAYVGFIYYFCPIYLNHLGESQSDIGRIYMIYGICLIYIAPFIGKYVDASDNKKGYVVFSGILASFGFLSFLVLDGITAAAITVLMMGLAGSFDSSRPYLLRMNVTRSLGAGKAMSIFSSFSRIGQIVGPVTFGSLYAAAGGRGVVWFGYAYLIATILFALVGQSERRFTRNSAQRGNQ